MIWQIFQSLRRRWRRFSLLMIILIKWKVLDLERNMILILISFLFFWIKPIKIKKFWYLIKQTKHLNKVIKLKKRRIYLLDIKTKYLINKVYLLIKQVHFLLIQHQILQKLWQAVSQIKMMIYVLFLTKFKKTKIKNNQFYFLVILFWINMRIFW